MQNNSHKGSIASTDTISYNDARWTSLGLSLDEIKYVIYLCSKFLNRRDTMDDLVQTAIINLYQAFEDHKQKGKEIRYRKGFISTIVVRNLIQVFIKKPKRDLLYKTTDVSDTEIEAIYNSEHLYNTEFNFQQFYEDYDASLSLLATLCDEDKFIMRAYYVDELTQEEIGNRLGSSQSTVSVKLSKLKKKLKKACLEMESEGEEAEC